MSVKSLIGGMIILAAGFLVLTICSSGAFQEYLWETFSELGSLA